MTLVPTACRLAASLLGGAVLLSGCTTVQSSTSTSSSGRASAGGGSAAGASSRGTAGGRHTSSGGGIAACDPAALPGEVPTVVDAVRAGGPFAHPRNDGVTFGNRERRLPQERRGYYREYTVDTPGSRTRGTRRIITGGTDARTPDHWYYTGDHYESFCELAP